MPEIVEEEEGEKAPIKDTVKTAASSRSPTSSDPETQKGDDDTIVKSPIHSTNRAKIAKQPQMPPFRGQGGNSTALVLILKLLTEMADRRRSF